MSLEEISDKLSNMLLNSSTLELNFTNWKFQLRKYNDELIIDDILRKVEFSFIFQNNDEAIIFTCTHRLSREPNKGNASRSLEDTEAIFLNIARKLSKKLIIIFPISKQSKTTHTSLRFWLEKNKYNKTNKNTYTKIFHL